MDDTITFSSSDKDRDLFRWFLGPVGDDSTEISADVFAKTGRNFAIKAGERVTVRLASLRQDLRLPPKAKKSSVTLKAVSTTNKAKRDQFKVNVNFLPPP